MDYILLRRKKNIELIPTRTYSKVELLMEAIRESKKAIQTAHGVPVGKFGVNEPKINNPVLKRLSEKETLAMKHRMEMRRRANY